MNIIMKSVEEIIPYENNPRINTKAVDKVMASIREYGFKVPILIDQNSVIIAGHTRLDAAKALGMAEVPVIKIDDLTEEQIRAFRIADNKTSEFAEWDFFSLSTELESLENMDLLVDFGFDESELSNIKSLFGVESFEDVGYAPEFTPTQASHAVTDKEVEKKTEEVKQVDGNIRRNTREREVYCPHCGQAFGVIV